MLNLPTCAEMKEVNIERNYGLQERVHIKDGNNPACKHYEIETRETPPVKHHTVWKCVWCGYKFSLPISIYYHPTRHYPKKLTRTD